MFHYSIIPNHTNIMTPRAYIHKSDDNRIEIVVFDSFDVKDLLQHYNYVFTKDDYIDPVTDKIAPAWYRSFPLALVDNVYWHIGLLISSGGVVKGARILINLKPCVDVPF